MGENDVNQNLNQSKFYSFDRFKRVRPPELTSGYWRSSVLGKRFFFNDNQPALTIPRRGAKKELSVMRLQDCHTVQNTRRASGAINNDCVLTYRQYLTDASFGVLLEGDTVFPKQIADALANPVWGVWLGRKACIPAAPILAGLRTVRDEAIKLFNLEKPLDAYIRQEDVKNFADGKDSLPDMSVSFASERRLFAPRRVKTWHVGEA